MKRYICPVLLLLLMVGIFCFSAQTADESTAESSRFCLLAAKLLFSDFAEWSASMQAGVVEGLTFAVRKAAHFTEYALMGFLWYVWLSEKRWNVLISFGATAFYAVTDEFHQLFVPGRSCELRDVLVDSAGGLTGILAAFVVLCVVHCIRRKDIVAHGTWKSSEAAIKNDEGAA